ncbi:MAG TPA: hypothetical protein PK419_10505 [Spirochaetota bacterium]|nr:MAG: hypothetical protein BWY39_00097 [Spirochaetes bacterium ADurb.Bin269]HPY03722.1 hypothetical protein [Spirochaetota bacterium]HQA53274.1 hypothetical protein [Spirochaetota bacterium]
MNTMNEIRFGDNLAVLKDNIVKTSILPQKNTELTRNLKLQGNVVIEGGVFSNTIDIENGPAVFKGAVYTNRELHILNTSKDTVIFEKAVASADSVNALLTAGQAVFGADINAMSVKLKNCFIAGSIFAAEVYLENCVVLGGVFGTKKITLQNTIAGTFNSPEVNMSGIDYLLYPSAFSVEPISPLPGTELFNLALADLGALYKGVTQSETSGKVRMDFQHDSQRTVLTDPNDQSGIGGNIIINSYSIATRVLAADMLDLEKLENHFLISAGSLGSQILKTYTLAKTDGTKSDELSLISIANFFFKILSGEIEVQELSSAVKLSDLKRMLE